MLFSSIIFIFYFLPIVLLLYYALRFSCKAQNVLLFLASILFYAWGEKKYTILLLISIGMNTLFGVLIDRFRAKKPLSKLILVIMCICNLGMLFVFKYLMFVVRNINHVFGASISVGQIVLPLGISFFTFQAISYVVDVYRGTVKVQKNPLYVGLYISFFPQLIAGPIVRYSSIADQIEHRTCTLDKFSVGCCRFISGLGKKMIIANNMAIVADHVYALNGAGEVSVALAWLGSIAYTLQIFFDFSAYSDMAIGLGLMFGFEFEENFNYPYMSTSISEFWRRWHISLTNWFKDYIYFPLGGSRCKNKDKIIRNMFIVWLLTGVWHGAEWTFIVWGLLNFLAIFVERFCGWDHIVKHVWLRRVLTLLMVNFGWVLFRSPDITQAWKYFGCMFGVCGNALISPEVIMFLKEYGVFFLLAILFSTPIAKKYNKFLVDGATGILGHVMTACYPITILAVFIICITFMVKGSYNPFIYFNF